MPKDGFEEVYEQYQPLLWGTLKQLSIYKDHEDFLQEARLALWEAYIRFDKEKGTFGAYAVKYVKGKVMRYLSNQNRHKQNVPFSFFEGEDEDYRFECEDELALAHYERLEWLDWMQPALKLCSSREQLLIREHFFKGKSIRELAEEERVSTDTVKTWKKRALQKCRKHLSPDIG